MPKYILIGLIVAVGTFMIMNYWSKVKKKVRNKIILSIFVAIGLGFILLIALLLF